MPIKNISGQSHSEIRTSLFRLELKLSNLQNHVKNLHEQVRITNYDRESPDEIIDIETFQKLVADMCYAARKVNLNADLLDDIIGTVISDQITKNAEERIEKLPKPGIWYPAPSSEDK